MLDENTFNWGWIDFIFVEPEFYSENSYPNCTHDLETYQEPTPQEGKYYLNGDTGQYYYQILDNTIQLLGIDLAELYDSWQDFDDLEPPSEELLEARAAAREEWLLKNSAPQKFEVVTLHETSDDVMLVTERTVTPDGLTLLFGIVLKDENTISGFENDGDFVLVE